MFWDSIFKLGKNKGAPGSWNSNELSLKLLEGFGSRMDSVCYIACKQEKKRAKSQQISKIMCVNILKWVEIVKIWCGSKDYDKVMLEHGLEVFSLFSWWYIVLWIWRWVDVWFWDGFGLESSYWINPAGLLENFSGENSRVSPKMAKSSLWSDFEPLFIGQDWCGGLIMLSG